MFAINLTATPYTPISFAELEAAGAFPPGAIPEAAYARMQAEYAKLEEVEVSGIIYKSDGLNVTGMMALPKKLKTAAHPIAIYNRGGNREFGRLELYSVMQMLAPLAKEGYLVFASNYRGNAGGEGKEEFGGADVNDVLNLLDSAKRHLAWDGKNAFMVGHSRGGMMTTLALKHGAKVNAAVTIAGVSDIIKSIEERPEMEAKVFSRIIPAANEAEREEAYRERSSLCWPERINVPLLLLHGDADDRVDVSHSIRLAEALKKLDKPHELVIYPRGNHALTRDWADVMARVKAWFARYKVELS